MLIIRITKAFSSIPKIGFNGGYKFLIIGTVLFIGTNFILAETTSVTKHLNGPGNGTTVQVEMTIGACDADTMILRLPKVTDNCDNNVDLVWNRSDDAEDLAAPLIYGATTSVNFKATDNAGNHSSKELIINVKPLPVCSIETPNDPPSVLTTGNTLAATTDACIVDYFWEVEGEGWAITDGNGTPTITYSAGSGDGVFLLVVTDEYNCQSQCKLSVSPIESSKLLGDPDYYNITTSSEEVTASGSLYVTANPNPFKKSTNINFTVEYDTEVEVEIYNPIGQLLEVIYDKHVSAGTSETAVYERKYREKQVYLYRVTTDRESAVGKLISE